MIARRFRALGWGAGISAAACGLYLISLQVAAERAKLDLVDARIAAAQRDMRQLQTELGTRANMRQLEKWNAETLSMAAPRAAQYLKGEYQLAALSAVDLAVRPPTVMAAVVTTAPRKIANLSQAAYTVARPEPTGTARTRPDTVRITARLIVERSTLSDLTGKAAAEARQR